MVYKISMELPGVAEEDIHLSVEDGVVQVKGEKKSEREEKGETWALWGERQFGKRRSFRLPSDADEAAVKAGVPGGWRVDGCGAEGAPKLPATTRADQCWPEIMPAGERLGGLLAEIRRQIRPHPRQRGGFA